VSLKVKPGVISKIGGRLKDGKPLDSFIMVQWLVTLQRKLPYIRGERTVLVGSNPDIVDFNLYDALRELHPVTYENARVLTPYEFAASFNSVGQIETDIGFVLYEPVFGEVFPLSRLDLKSWRDSECCEFSGQLIHLLKILENVERWGQLIIRMSSNISWAAFYALYEFCKCNRFVALYHCSLTLRPSFFIHISQGNGNKDGFLQHIKEFATEWLRAYNTHQMQPLVRIDAASKALECAECRLITKREGGKVIGYDLIVESEEGTSLSSYGKQTINI